MQLGARNFKELYSFCNILVLALFFPRVRTTVVSHATASNTLAVCLTVCLTEAGHPKLFGRLDSNH